MFGNTPTSRALDLLKPCVELLSTRKSVGHLTLAIYKLSFLCQHYHL
jgi:hypothetical protein